MEKKYTLETHQRVYNDETGDYIEVRPDRDSLGLFEISHNFEGEETANITINKEQLDLLIEALQAFQGY